jgi:tetratricopeptide (TPR) repeat protein
LALALLACLTLAGYSIIRVTSVALTARGNSVQDFETARPYYETAMWLDDENPDARYYLGMRLFNEQQYAEAVPFLREAIQIGRAGSADYSYLATAMALAGDNVGAERIMADATSLYTRSPFVLTRYAALLRDNNKSAESTAQLDRALSINKRAANTWWTMITEGPRAASDRAFRDKDYSEIMDLQPQASIYAVKTERDIRFPEEKANFDFAR